MARNMSSGIIWMGMSTMLALALVTYITFFTAYFSPTKSAHVQVNNYGEANIEMIILSVLLPLNLISMIIVNKRLADRSNEEMATG